MYDDYDYSYVLSGAADAGASTCAAALNGRDVFVRWLAPRTYVVTASASANTRLAAFTGCRQDSDLVCGNTSINFLAQEGTTYYFRLRCVQR